jgi:DNA polymerase elongation subunit (family B)
LKKTLWGFTNNEKKQYIRLKFKSKSCFYFVRKFLSRYDTKTGGFMNFGGIMTKIDFHESNVEPMLRFIHCQNIQPGGWVILKRFEDTNDILASKCQVNLTVSWKDVQPFDNTSIAPFIIMSFDIECTSSHGDFPLAQKNYRKSANELIDYYRRVEYSIGLKDNIKNALQSIFDPTLDGLLSIAYTKCPFVLKDICLLINMHVDDIINIIESKYTYKDVPKQYDGIPWEGHRINLGEKDSEIVIKLELKMNKLFPEIKGDPIIQIGSTLHRYGETSCFYKNIITLGTCDDICGIDVTCCETEEEVITEWCNLLNKVDPDIITGYNILGFDFSYMYQRAIELDCTEELLGCSRLMSHESVFREKNLSSSALGDNTLRYIDMEGRIIIDIMKIVQRDHKLDSYKLDNVIKSFINGKVKKITGNRITVENTTGLNVGDYVYMGALKYKIDNISDKTICLDKPVISDDTVTTWGLAKDDVTPKDIFKCQLGTSADRAMVAKYCVQDSALCNSIMIKLEVIANNLGMANVCMVPLSYIFLRGQGVKIFSLVAKQCKEDNFIIPCLKYDPDSQDNDDGYEGAIVLDPIPGVYTTAPISVMDYASLYPASMISENISHDSLVLDNKYANVDGFEYVNISYDLFSGVGEKKKKIGEHVCRYAQFPNNEKGVLPRILMKLLSQRKETRNKIKHKRIILTDDSVYEGMVSHSDDCFTTMITTDNRSVKLDARNIKSKTDLYNEFAKAVLDGLQLAYKITANSLYGSVGARTSSIYMKELAASTTSTGRNLILQAKQFMEQQYDANVIYGDTDSIFVDFKIKEKYGLEGKDGLQKSIDISIEASGNFKKKLKYPHDLEYEKTFFPFIILAKKKYVGNLYEHDVNTFSQKSMGIVLKRRDNANIVKYIYGGIIDILLEGRDIHTSITFLKQSLRDLVEGKFGMGDLIISKTLRKQYVDPSKIAHKVLADRMSERDPGSAPQVNERIPYVYIEHNQKNKKLLQGDKIEHPTFITDNKLKINYTFYITNQISKPVCQLLALCLFDIPKSNTATYYNNKELKLSKTLTARKTKDKINELKQNEVNELLFSPILNELNNIRMGNKPLTEFFKRIPPA